MSKLLWEPHSVLTNLTLLVRLSACLSHTPSTGVFTTQQPPYVEGGPEVATINFAGAGASRRPTVQSRWVVVEMLAKRGERK